MTPTYVKRDLYTPKETSKRDLYTTKTKNHEERFTKECIQVSFQKRPTTTKTKTCCIQVSFQNRPVYNKNKNHEERSTKETFERDESSQALST